MEYWLVQHDIEAYWDRPYAIGSPKARALRDRNFCQMSKGDKIVYYAKQKRTLGLFQISSERWSELKSWSKSRKGPHMIYQTKPICTGTPRYGGREAGWIVPEGYRCAKEDIITAP